MQPQTVFAERLIQLRESRHGLSRRTLSELCGLPSDTIRKYERGEVRNPSADSLLAIADFFNVSIDYLVGRSETK